MVEEVRDPSLLPNADELIAAHKPVPEVIEIKDIVDPSVPVEMEGFLLVVESDSEDSKQPKKKGKKIAKKSGKDHDQKWSYNPTPNPNIPTLHYNN